MQLFQTHSNVCSLALHSAYTQVRELEKLRVVGVACGLRTPHTLAVTETGILWTWGDASFGKLGIDKTQYCSSPQKVHSVCTCMY